MSINDNIMSNISNIIEGRNTDYNKPVRILNVFYEFKLPIGILKEKYKNIEIIDYKLANHSVEDMSIFGIGQTEDFDYIILFETLEKLINPDIFLKNIKKYLKSTGNIICSIPNIMYKNVLNDLLVGKFTYCKEGILNKSNLRFFTLEEVRRLLDKEKYNIDQIMAIITSSTQEDVELVDKLCNLSSNDELRMNFNSYSYIISVSKKANKTLYDYVLNN
ncbi:MAG: methyltransferase domain-containing protein [Romboutsia sp.]